MKIHYISFDGLPALRRFCADSVADHVASNVGCGKAGYFPLIRHANQSRSVA
jgi:hypothetical protein